ncbi:MAG: cytochrome c family protein [Gemmataceae bacterium]|nr:cytochrome c family protein [Gemmataceae bacterium]MDW8243116.1 cytochrome c3 family protein [Thermogemmata sp.]
MPQVFPKALNPIAKVVVLGFPLLLGSAGLTGAAFYRSSYATGVDEILPQPVAFSHAHHVGQLGIDCRYCHTSVENSSSANIPPTKTCMNCHQQIWQGADMLAPVRESYRQDKPIEWNRVHNVPHYVYFNHSIHIAKGVGCVECHGRVDQVNLTKQHATLLMEWCIACHREPEKFLRPRSEVFSMTWTPAKGGVWQPEDFFHADSPEAQTLIGTPRPTTQQELGALLKEQYKVRDRVTLTNCSMCHR